jgi:type I restriction enzyme, S subunit
MSAAVRAGYKLTEVGLIPSDWGVKTLDSLTLLMTNGFVGIATSAYVETEDGVLYIQGYNVEANGFNLHGIKRVSKAFHLLHLKSCLREGDLLTVQTGDIGVTTSVPVTLIGSNCHALVITRFDKRYSESLYYCQYFNSERGRIAFKVIETGSTMKHLNVGDMKCLLVPSPPFSEQRAIAAALSDVDALLAKQGQLIAKKQSLKQAAMQQLLTGQTRLPGFSGDWELKPLRELFSFSGGLSASRDQLSDSGYCYLHYGDIHKSGKTYIDVDAEHMDIPKLTVRLSDVSPSALLKDGDVVFVDASEDDAGTSKHLVVVNPNNLPYISGLHTIVAKSKANALDNKFKRYCFQTRSVKAQFLFFAVGTKVSGISKTSIAKIELKFPPLHEQAAIGALLSNMDTEIAALEARQTKTRALKQGMMQELLTGKTRLI